MDQSTRILVVDDFPMIRSILIRHLAEQGFHDIAEAADGQTAWAMLNQASTNKNPFGLVFLDWNMPKMSGIELIEKCRAQAHFADIPIVVVTAEREKANVVKALQAGATDYMMKPIKASVLTTKITSLIERSKKVA